MSIDQEVLDAPVGRLRNSAGHPADAAGFFENAASIAEAAGERFLLVDALHMLGIVQSERSAAHVATAFAVLDAEPSADRRTQRWRVTLHNNRGWALLDTGKLTAALHEFELALRDARHSAVNRRERGGASPISRWRSSSLSSADYLVPSSTSRPPGS